jgi:hypothetical protein
MLAMYAIRPEGAEVGITGGGRIDVAVGTVGVAVAVGVAVLVGVTVGRIVGVAVGVGVGVGVRVGVGVSVSAGSVAATEILSVGSGAGVDVSVTGVSVIPWVGSGSLVSLSIGRTKTRKTNTTTAMADTAVDSTFIALSRPNPRRDSQDVQLSSPSERTDDLLDDTFLDEGCCAEALRSSIARARSLA